mmetsp:Transcript_144559/g.463218  ORF Transcript_144559/g.463218 Transcript_144559/m.463218 type:complete len:211 (+) Transcript_144559:615-1247(+)
MCFLTKARRSFAACLLKKARWAAARSAAARAAASVEVWGLTGASMQQTSTSSAAHSAPLQAICLASFFRTLPSAEQFPKALHIAGAPQQTSASASVQYAPLQRTSEAWRIKALPEGQLLKVLHLAAWVQQWASSLRLHSSSKQSRACAAWVLCNVGRCTSPGEHCRDSQAAAKITSTGKVMGELPPKAFKVHCERSCVMPTATGTPMGSL